MEQNYFTKLEAAQYLRLSLRSVDYLREKGLLKPFRVGKKKLLFTRADLDRCIQRQTADVDLDVLVEETLTAFKGGK